MSLEVGVTPRRVVACVRDHGTGFDAEDGTTEGLGLSSMKERVSLLGALVPEPGGGARAEAARKALSEGWISAWDVSQED